MNNILFNDVPLFCEVIFDDKAVSISFCLCPKANDFLCEVLGGENRIADFLRKGGYKLSEFIQPNKKGWGFGKVFRLNNKKSIEEGWITWECVFPSTPGWQRLEEIAGSIWQLSMALSIFEQKEILQTQKLQLFRIDSMAINSGKHFHGSAFSFTYSRQVLDFATKIWSDEQLFEVIKKSMRKAYTRLTGGGPRLIKLMEGEFYLGQSQNNPRWPYFRVPGDCACIGPDHRFNEREYGSGYFSHNVDTKIQQLTLLAGIIKLANSAREIEANSL